jgi:signal peptidase I
MRTLRRRVAPAFLGLVALGTLIALWPARLGGAVTYVGTHGSSMEPLFHQGDLAVVRSAHTYRVGDVVAYRSRLLHTVVLHRIVALDHGHFVMKGDNNSWLDAEQPTPSDVIGRLWLRVPGGSTLVSRWMPIAALALGVAVAFGGASTATVRRRRRSERTSMPARHNLASVRRWRAVAVALAVCAVTSVAVTAYALTQPTTVTAVTKLPYTQRAEFKYTAAAPTSVYDSGHVDTGDPVFLRAATTVEITATYDFAADAPHTVSGNIALSAEIRDGSGWHRSFELAAPSPFTGTHAERTAQLDLGRVQALLADVRDATGTNNGSYIVDVVSNITATGNIGDRPLDATFAPRIEFQLDALRLAPTTQDAASKAPFTTSATQDLQTSRRITNRAELGWLKVPIGTLRGLGLVGVIVASCAAALAAVALRRRLPDEVAKIALRHRHRLLPVRAGEMRDGVSVLDVTSIGDLVRLADQHQMLILHERAPGSDTYHFQIDRTVYRYVSACERPVSRSPRPSRER